MDAFVNRISKIKELNEPLILEMVEQIKAENGLQSLTEVHRHLMDQLVKLPMTHKNWHVANEVCAEVKKMIRHEQGGIANVYQKR